MLSKIFLTVFCVLGVAILFLYVRYPFVFQELASLPSMLSTPDIAKPDPTITQINQLDSFIASQFEENNIPGASVAIVANGNVVWSNGYGVTNLNAPQPITADTPFMIGSISKAVMGVTLMHAVQNGFVDLDQDINSYLPFNIKNPRVNGDNPITLRHLATHTSGIVDSSWHYMSSYAYGDPNTPLAQFLPNYLTENGETFNPNRNFSPDKSGAVYEYSNIGAGLAGYVISEATGSRLDLYAKQHIFTPLNMINTGWFLADFADETAIAQPHALWNRPYPHYGYPTWPDGQLRTSANDLARLLAMVMNGGTVDGVQVLDPDTVATLLQKQTFAGLDEKSGEGIFWTYSKNGYIGHDGGDVGVTAVMYFNPENNIGVVILSNASGSKAISPVFTIARQILAGEGTGDLIASLSQ